MPTQVAVAVWAKADSTQERSLAGVGDLVLPSFTQHLSVLKRFGLVKSRRTGRVRTFELAPKRLQAAEDWISDRRKPWERRLDQLDAYLLEMKETDDADEK